MHIGVHKGMHMDMEMGAYVGIYTSTVYSRYGVSNIWPTKAFNVTPKGILNKLKTNDIFCACTSWCGKGRFPPLPSLSSIPESKHPMSYISESCCDQAVTPSSISETYLTCTEMTLWGTWGCSPL